MQIWILNGKRKRWLGFMAEWEKTKNQQDRVISLLLHHIPLNLYRCTLIVLSKCQISGVKLPRIPQFDLPWTATKQRELWVDPVRGTKNSGIVLVATVLVTRVCRRLTWEARVGRSRDLDHSKHTGMLEEEGWESQLNWERRVRDRGWWVCTVGSGSHKFLIKNIFLIFDI